MAGLGWRRLSGWRRRGGSAAGTKAPGGGAVNGPRGPLLGLPGRRRRGRAGRHVARLDSLAGGGWTCPAAGRTCPVRGEGKKLGLGVA